MDNAVKIYENILPKKTLDYLLDFVLFNNEHRYGHASNFNSDKFFYFKDFSDNIYLADSIFQNILDKIKMNLRYNRVYANIQYVNQDGEFHIDAHEMNAYTCMIMLSKTLQEGSGCFCTKEQNYAFIQNNLLVFKSNIQHMGAAPKEGREPRVTFVYKTLLQN
tara:strand:- start:138 stop:626 length:489 start_codon:yes stop_codon:yes gene_type:complete